MQGIMRAISIIALVIVLIVGCRDQIVGEDEIVPTSTAVLRKVTATPAANVEQVAASMIPTEADEQSCTPERLRYLVDQFFAAYNHTDLAGLEALFSGTYMQMQYYDDVAGQTVDLRDRDAIMQYMQRRFAVKDQFVVTDVGIPKQGSPAQANPTIEFTRTSTEGAYRGNMKLVCLGGKITSIVTSSTATS